MSKKTRKKTPEVHQAAIKVKQPAKSSLIPLIHSLGLTPELREKVAEWRACKAHLPMRMHYHFLRDFLELYDTTFKHHFTALGGKIVARWRWALQEHIGDYRASHYNLLIALTTVNKGVDTEPLWDRVESGAWGITKAQQVGSVIDQAVHKRKRDWRAAMDYIVAAVDAGAKVRLPEDRAKLLNECCKAVAVPRRPTDVQHFQRSNTRKSVPLVLWVLAHPEAPKAVRDSAINRFLRCLAVENKLDGLAQLKLKGTLDTLVSRGTPGLTLVEWAQQVAQGNECSLLKAVLVKADNGFTEACFSLGLDPRKVTLDQLRSKHRQLVKEHHPDKSKEDPSVMAYINTKFEFIKNRLEVDHAH